MKLYIGSRDYCPEGFKTVDIDDKYNPDYVADVCDMFMISDGVADEVSANALLEHIEWPKAFLALSEITRVLKYEGILRISVPDLGTLCKMISSCRSSWYAVSLLYGAGGGSNIFEQHKFGYTKEMLETMLLVLGYRKFEHFNSNVPDSTNGWLYDVEGNKIAASLNIKCSKMTEPIVNSKELYSRLKMEKVTDFLEIIRSYTADEGVGIRYDDYEKEDITVQSMFEQLIEARQRVQYLEKEEQRLMNKKLIGAESLSNWWMKIKMKL